MKKKLLYFLGGGIMTVGMLYGGIALAAPLYFSPGVTTVANNSLATTSVSFMTPGTATTTTNVYDAYSDGTNEAANFATLLVQMTGSSTPTNAAIATTTYAISIEYSQNSVDWYSNSAMATTTTLGWQTLKGSLVASSTPTKELVSVPTPLRYTRAVITIPVGSTNGAVWAQLVPAKEQK